MPTDTEKHLLSKKALESLFDEDRTTSKLETVRGQSFADALFLNVITTDPTTVVLKEVPLADKGVYAQHFHNIQQTVGCDLGVTNKIEEGGGLFGFVPYYIYEHAALGDETIYAVYVETGNTPEDLSEVIFMTAVGPDTQAVAVAQISKMGLMLSFGKLCGWCGQRRKAPKLLTCPCRKARYCSKECQKAHWADHRACCNRGQAEI